MNVLPRMYMSAIDREIAEIKENLSFSRRHGGNDVVPLYEAEIMGLEMAKNIIQRTYRAYQEITHETRAEAKSSVRGREVLSIGNCRAY
jgi:hypothetical protein